MGGGVGVDPLKMGLATLVLHQPLCPTFRYYFQHKPLSCIHFYQLYLTYQVRFADESINVLLRDNMEIQRLTPKTSFRILGYILLGCMSSRHMYMLNEGNLLMRFLPPPPHASPM